MIWPQYARETEAQAGGPIAMVDVQQASAAISSNCGEGTFGLIYVRSWWEDKGREKE